MLNHSVSDPIFPLGVIPPIASLLQSVACGVGSKQEETIAEVRGANACRGNAVPFRNPPARGQVFEDFTERLPRVD